MSIAAMRYALDVLDNYVEDPRCETHRATAVHFLEQAIAEAEKQKPVAFRNIETGEFCTGGFLRKDLAKWQPLYAAPVYASDTSQEPVDQKTKDRHEFDDDIYDVWKEKNT